MKMKRCLVAFFVIALAVLAYFLLRSREDFFLPQTSQWMSALRKNASVKIRLLTGDHSPNVEIMVHHGWAYGTWEVARLEGKIHDHAVLIHLDSHDDNVDLQPVMERPATVEEARPIEYNIERFIAPAIYYG